MGQTVSSVIGLALPVVSLHLRSIASQISIPENLVGLTLFLAARSTDWLKAQCWYKACSVWSPVSYYLHCLGCCSIVR